MPNKFSVSSKKEITTHYLIHIWDNIKEYEDYDTLIEHLNSINLSKDSVELSISSNGGRCDIGFMLFDKLKQFNCDVIVPYPTYSMGALLSLVGKSLELKPGSFMMFHDFSSGKSGKGNEIVKSIDAYTEVFRYRFNKICQPFLTKKECKDILNGQDLYVKWNDKDLEQRIKRHFK